MRVLVTGAGGFLARYVTSAILDSRLSIDSLVLLDLPGREPTQVSPGRNIRFVSADLLDPEELSEALSGLEEVDLLLHLAAVLRDEDQERLYQSNVSMTAILLSSARANRIVLASSSAVYGKPLDETIPVDEEHPERPLSAYGSSCLERERLARASGSDVTILRLFNLAGPGQSPDMLVPSVAEQLARMELRLQAPVLSLASLDSERDYVDVRDAAEAFRLVAEAGTADLPAVMNVSTGVLHASGDIVDALISLSSASPELSLLPGTVPGSSAVPSIAGDSSLIRRRLAWRPTRDIRDTLSDTLHEARRKLKGT